MARTKQTKAKTMGQAISTTQPSAAAGKKRKADADADADMSTASAPTKKAKMTPLAASLAASRQAKSTAQPSAAAGKKRKADDAPGTASTPAKKAKSTTATTVALNSIDAAATKAMQLKQVGPMQRSGLSNKFKKAELAAAAEQEPTQALCKKRKAGDDDDHVNEDLPPTKKGKTDDDSASAVAAAPTTTTNHRILPPSTFNEQACPLLHKLPLELRDRIWADALEEPGTVKLRGKEAETGEVKVPRPSLFQVCRQTRQEAWNIYYKVNTFETDDTDVACGFLKQISAECYINESDDGKKKKVKSHPGLVALKGLLITDPFKVLQSRINLYIAANPALQGYNWGQIVGDLEPRSLRKIRRCLMAIKYASGRKGLHDGVVKFQMQVHKHQDVLNYFIPIHNRVDNFVIVGSEWLEVTAEQVGAHEFIGRSMFHNKLKYTTVKP